MRLVGRGRDLARGMGRRVSRSEQGGAARVIAGSRLGHAVRLLLAAVLSLGLAACGGETSEIEWPDGPVPAEEPAPLPTTIDPAYAVAVEEILAVVRGFRETEARTFTDPPLPPTAEAELSDYLADPLLSQTLNTLNEMRQGGMRFEGRQQSTPEVAELALDADPPTARVRDCVDASGWRLVFDSSGEAVPGDGFPDRFVAWMELKEYDDGWLLHHLEMSEESPC